MTRLSFPFYAALASLLFALSLLMTPAAAHEMRPAIADLSFADGEARLSIDLNLEAAIAGIGPRHDDTEDAPEAETYDALRAGNPAELAEAFEQFKETFLSKLTIESGGQALDARIVDNRFPAVGDVSLARESVLTLAAPLPDSTNAVVIGWDESLGSLILRAPGLNDDAPYSAFLSGGETSDPIAVSGAKAPGTMATAFDYLGLGYTHILPKGLDHILFVIGLFLLSARLGPLLWQVTGFTLAHTVTLALGITGVVSVSPAIVEPLIAASIVWICIENVFSDRMAAWRPFVVFGFGLLHGLGFAGVLGELGMPEGQFVTALIAFNIGVELGQLTVIVGCFLAVGLWFRNKPWYRSRITIPASILIACIGAYWFVERVGLV